MQKANIKVDDKSKEKEQEKDNSDGNVLMSDSCLHYLTVASFGYQDKIAEKYEEKLILPLKKGIK
jgi:hypothetical protein